MQLCKSSSTVWKIIGYCWPFDTSVCPSCSNLLIVTRVTSSTEHEQDRGKNRLECRTCPFQFVIDKRYYDRMTLKPKEVEDIVGGKDSFEHVDKTEGNHITSLSSLSWFVLTNCSKSNVLTKSVPRQLPSSISFRSEVPTNPWQASSKYKLLQHLQPDIRPRPLTPIQCVKCARQWRE